MTKRKTAKQRRLPSPLMALELARAVQSPAPSQPPAPPSAWVVQGLIDRPELIARPEWRDVIVRLARAYVALKPPAEPTAAEIAVCVEHLLLKFPGQPPLSVKEARQQVAAETGRTYEAVKTAHTRFLRPKRVKREPT